MLSVGRAKPLLGISFCQRALRVAEVTRGPNSGTSASDPAARIAEFSFPSEISLEQATPAQAEELGKALAHFLKWHGFSSRRVIFGVPAKWLITKPLEMPPADQATAANILWLRATAEFPAELGPWVFDYAGEISARQPSRLLLVGLQRQWMDRIAAVAKGAGLKIIAVTPSSAALGAATASHVDHSLVLSLHLDNAELAILDGSRLRSLRHIGSTSSVQPLIAELRRAAVATAVTAGPDAAPDPAAPRTHWRRGLVIWDDAGVDPAFLEALRSSIDLPLISATPQWLDVAAPAAGSCGGLCATALTLADRLGEQSPINFLRPRLTPPKSARTNRGALWISAAAAVFVLAVLLAYADIAHIEGQISHIENKLELLDPALKTERPFVTSMRYAASFRSASPRCLACLRDLTLAVDADGQTYFTSFNLQTDMTGQVVGHSSSETNILNLMDKLNAGGKFTAVNMKLDAHEALRRETRGGGEVSFSVTFSYVPKT